MTSSDDSDQDMSVDEISDLGDPYLTDASTVSLDGSILASGEEYEVDSLSDASGDDCPINTKNQWKTLFRADHRIQNPSIKSNTAPGKITRTLCTHRAEFTETSKGKLDLKKQEKQAIKGAEISMRWLEKKLDHFTALGTKAKTRSRIPLEHKFPLKYFYRVKNDKCKCIFCSYSCDLDDSEKIRLTANHMKRKHRIVD